MITHELTTGDDMGVTTLEAFGSTRLTTVADAYFFNGASGGPQLKMNGVNVAPGQFGAWTPIGAEQSRTALPGRLEEWPRRPVRHLDR